jgi:transcriptional regulator with XRE-family HTH domain
MGQDEAAGSHEQFSYEERRRTLRKVRKKAKISQVRLAELAGVDHFSISRFEAGSRDVSPKMLKKIEEALSDVMAGQKVTALLRAQRTQTDVLSEMAPPRREPGSESYWTAREQSVQKGSRPTTHLMLENSGLREENANLSEQVNILRGIVEMLQEQATNWQETCTLQSEVIRLFEEEEVKRPAEADALLKRAAAVVKK